MNTFDIVFFDLEKTLIESWDVPVVDNVDKILNALKDINCSEFGIFSFAIWSPEDREEFISRIAPRISETFGIQFNPLLVPTKKEIHQKIKADGKEIFISRQGFSFEDFVELWSKDRAFIDWCRASFINKNIAFFDDVVSDCNLLFPEVSIRMFRV